MRSKYAEIIKQKGHIGLFEELEKKGVLKKISINGKTIEQAIKESNETNKN